MNSRPHRTSRNSSQVANALLVCNLLCQGRKQKDIATELGLTEPKISRLVHFALDAELVRLVFCPPQELSMSQSLTQTLEQFGMRLVSVVPGKAAFLCNSAARFFESEGRAGMTVVVDGGKTISRWVECLIPKHFRALTLIPICADPPRYDISAYEIMTQLAAKFPTVVNCLKLPHLTGGKLDPIHNKVKKKAESADFVIMGAGPWRKRHTALEFIDHLGLDPRTLREKYPQVVGMCGYQALTETGEKVEIPEIDERMPRSLGYEGLRRLAASGSSNVLLLAAGDKKLPAVTAAIRARLFNTLFVDEKLAMKLLGAFS